MKGRTLRGREVWEGEEREGKGEGRSGRGERVGLDLTLCRSPLSTARRMSEVTSRRVNAYLLKLSSLDFTVS